MVQNVVIRIFKTTWFHLHYTYMYVQLQACLRVLNWLMLLLTLLVVWREAATDWNSWSAIEETSSKYRNACHAKKRFVSETSTLFLVWFLYTCWVISVNMVLLLLFLFSSILFGNSHATYQSFLLLRIESFAWHRQHPMRCLFLLHVVTLLVWVYVFINIMLFSCRLKYFYSSIC